MPSYCTNLTVQRQTDSPALRQTDMVDYIIVAQLGNHCFTANHCFTIQLHHLSPSSSLGLISIPSYTWVHLLWLCDWLVTADCIPGYFWGDQMGLFCSGSAHCTQMFNNSWSQENIMDLSVCQRLTEIQQTCAILLLIENEETLWVYGIKQSISVTSFIGLINLDTSAISLPKSK